MRTPLSPGDSGVLNLYLYFPLEGDHDVAGLNPQPGIFRVGEGVHGWVVNVTIGGNVTSQVFFSLLEVSL